MAYTRSQEVISRVDFARMWFKCKKTVEVAEHYGISKGAASNLAASLNLPTRSAIKERRANAIEAERAFSDDRTPRGRRTVVIGGDCQVTLRRLPWEPDFSKASDRPETAPVSRIVAENIPAATITDTLRILRSAWRETCA